jgi:hypothetical protein
MADCEVGGGGVVERMATKFTKRVRETISEIDEISQNISFTKVAKNRFQEFREIFAFRNRKIVSKKYRNVSDYWIKV